MISINDILRDLFENIPYSEKSENAKEAIKEALKVEYSKEIENGKSSIQAIGELMGKYGTIEQAGKLVGFSDEEILNLSCFEQVTDKAMFKKQFRKVRWNIYIASCCLILSIVSLLDVFFFSSWLYLLTTCIFLVPTIVCIRNINRNKKEFNYKNINLNSEAYEFLKLLSDRYAKRSFNSIFIGVIILFYQIFIISVSALTMKLKFGEIIQQVFLMISTTEFFSYLILKNSLCKKYLENLDINRNIPYKKHRRILLIASMCYWVAILSLTFFINKLELYFNAFYISVIVYVIFVLIYNLTLRKAVIYRNIVINKKRIASFGIAIVIIVAYSAMRMSSWLIQPYISTVSAVEYVSDEILYNEETGIYTITTKKEDFKILQLTDIHLGGSSLSSVKDYKALNSVYTLINHTKPDLVIVTGDLVFPMGVMSFSFNNYTPIMQFASFMRNIGIPWAFLYGNHDTENMANNTAEEIDELLKSVSFKTSKNLLYPYIQPEITGRNNQLIEIRNEDGTLNQAVFLLDSNDYINDVINDYDYIHDDEVEWYESKVKELNEKEGKIISSLVFFHMPLQEYREAYELNEKGSEEVEYFFGENGEKMIDKVCCSEYPSKLFDTALKLGSTKAMFCGHDHYNNLSVKYKGIRLTYGMSIDYLVMPGIEKDTKQRGGTLITLYSDSEYDIEQVKLMDITD